MRIDFECSGGYAGLQLEYHVDTDELPQELAEKLLSLVERAAVFDLQPEKVAPEIPDIPDVLSYRLTLHEGDRMISLSLNDITAPDSLRPLLSFLHELALKQCRKK